MFEIYISSFIYMLMIYMDEDIYALFICQRYTYFTNKTGLLRLRLSKYQRIIYLYNEKITIKKREYPSSAFYYHYFRRRFPVFPSCRAPSIRGNCYSSTTSKVFPFYVSYLTIHYSGLLTSYFHLNYIYVIHLHCVHFYHAT